MGRGWVGAALVCLALVRPDGARAEGGEVTVVAAGKEASLAIGGFLQMQGEFGDKGDSRFGSENDRFYLRRARLNATGKFKEEFDFVFEVDLSGTLSETSNLRAQLTDGYINWNRYKFSMIKMGQFKTPFGYEFIAADTRILTIERTLAIDRLTLGRQLGMVVWGDLWEKRLSYSAGAFNGTVANSNSNDDDQFLYAARVTGVPWQGQLLRKEGKWRVGGDFYVSHNDRLGAQPGEFGFDSTPDGTLDNAFVGDRAGASLDTQLGAGPFDLWLEYIRVRFKPDSEVPFRCFDADGWYAQASYFLVEKRLQLLAKFDAFEPDRRVHDDSTRTWTAGVNYYIKGDDLKILLDYLSVDVPGQRDRQDKLLARFQLVF